MPESFPTIESKEQPKSFFLKIDLQNVNPKKKESEDASFLDKNSKILVAADGITRGPIPEGKEYPFPSPAAKAAKIFAETFGNFLANRDALSKQDLLAAVYKANLEVEELNRQLGFWEKNDYLENDLASTVFGACVQRGNEMLYAFIGDSGVAKLSEDGTILWSTPDEVTPLRPLFPKVADVGVDERNIRVRRDFRNNPEADHDTFGVMSGEEAAMSYVRVGSIPIESGETMIAYSDGIVDFLERSSEFRELIVSGNQEKLKAFLEEHSDPKTHSDDKTLVAYRVE